MNKDTVYTNLDWLTDFSAPESFLKKIKTNAGVNILTQVLDLLETMRDSDGKGFSDSPEMIDEELPEMLMSIMDDIKTQCKSTINDRYSKEEEKTRAHNIADRVRESRNKIFGDKE